METLNKYTYYKSVHSAIAIATHTIETRSEPAARGPEESTDDDAASDDELAVADSFSSDDVLVAFSTVHVLLE